MTLKAELRRRIARDGPLGVNEYMALCLHDPVHGYYATRPALGPEGDFITAPLVSQMFGELIGVWAVETWRRLGSPDPLLLVEVGPGDGTLMEDLLRAARIAPDFLAAAEVWLVEPSAPLREMQRRRLSSGARTIRWTESLDGLPYGRELLLVANEVLDCMPARQFQRIAEGWVERKVGLVAGELAWVSERVDLQGAPDVPEGAVVEHSERQGMFSAAVAGRVARQGGCALLIDYGRTELEPGDTLQALRRHEKVDPLAAPGECDLTMWADFAVVAGAAEGVGAAVAGPISQADFLGRLGLELRAERLSRLRPDRAATIARQVHRLTAPDQMGQLFKAIAIHRLGDPAPPAFETPA